jgi:hypothetical protein
LLAGSVKKKVKIIEDDGSYLIQAHIKFTLFRSKKYYEISLRAALT